VCQAPNEELKMICTRCMMTDDMLESMYSYVKMKKVAYVSCIR
jgi:hypothetical protein